MKIKEVIKYMKEKDINPLIVDAWSESKREIFNALKEKYDEGKREYKKDGYKILIEYTPSNGIGMGEHPSEMKISVLIDWNTEKVVNIENIKYVKTLNI